MYRANLTTEDYYQNIKSFKTWEEDSEFFIGQRMNG